MPIPTHPKNASLLFFKLFFLLNFKKNYNFCNNFVTYTLTFPPFFSKKPSSPTSHRFNTLGATATLWTNDLNKRKFGMKTRFQPCPPTSASSSNFARLHPKNPKITPETHNF